MAGSCFVMNDYRYGVHYSGVLDTLHGIGRERSILSMCIAGSIDGEGLHSYTGRSIFGVSVSRHRRMI
jgi:hypothetical protein